ncbi:MAG: Xaa-Pro dipeptidase [Gammaproteobacteria bacterium]|jgi:Xaa-Pro dipeptidase
MMEETEMPENLPAHDYQLLAFDESVYRDRLRLIQSKLSDHEVSAVLLFNPENIYWLTGYQTIGYFTFHCLLVRESGKPVVIGRVVTKDLALAHPTIGGFIEIVDTAQPVDILINYLKGALSQSDVLGLETRAWNFTVADYLDIQKRISVKNRECNGLVEPYRMVKSEAEIDCMKLAARAAEAGLEAAINAIAPGKTENDIAAAMFEATVAAGSEYLGHPPLVVVGKTTSLCFAMWRRRAIKKGDVVLLESAGCVERYHAMLSRPVVVGKPRLDQTDAANALQSVLEAAIDTIRPGLTAGEVDQACRQHVEREGLGQYFKHRAAYGIGIGFPPNWSEGHIYAIRPDDPLVLQENMTFHVIPTLFLNDFGMCFSDSVRVTDSGCELLTHFPRKFYSIDV